MWQGGVCAVKFVVADSDNTLACNACEAMLSKMLSHPHIVQVCLSVSQATAMTELHLAGQPGMHARCCLGGQACPYCGACQVRLQLWLEQLATRR